MKNYIYQLENLGANVVGCLSIGKTYYSPVDDINPTHPWTFTEIRSGEKVEPIFVEPVYKETVVESKYSQTALSEVISVAIEQDTIAEEKNNYQAESLEDSLHTSKQYNFGDIIEFGTFYTEPIKWEVLEQKGNKVLLISKYGLTCRAYNDKLENTSWSECSLRKWLNKVFFERSFSAQEKKNMISHLVNAEVVSGRELNPGENTKDFVHILSIDDYLKFYDNKNHHWKSRLIKDKRTEKQCWLRNYGYDRTRAAFIGRSGRIHYNGSFVDKPRNTVRPVILIKI